MNSNLIFFDDDKINSDIEIDEEMFDIITKKYEL